MFVLRQCKQDAVCRRVSLDNNRKTASGKGEEKKKKAGDGAEEQLSRERGRKQLEVLMSR